MKATLSDARTSRIPFIANLCSDDSRVADLVNEAQRRLIRLGKWWGLYQKIKICIDRTGCVTWPRQVAGLENVAVNNVPVRIRNEWYEFLDASPGLMPKRNGNCSSCSVDYCWPTLDLYDRGTVPAFGELSPPNKKLRFYPTNSADVGKRILVKGHDQNKIWIRTLDAGAMIDGIYVTLALPFVDTAIELWDFTSIQKPVTADRVLMYELDTVTAGVRQLGDYESDETTPVYRRSLIYNLDKACGKCCDGTTTKTITAMAKLEFVAAVNDNDILMIGNLDAIKDMVQAILKRENNLEAEAVALERAALRELNRELDHYLGTDKQSIGLNIWRSPSVRNRLYIN